MGDASQPDLLSKLIDFRGIITNLLTEIILAVAAVVFYWLSRRLPLWFTVPALWKAYGATVLCVGTLYFAPVQASALRILASVLAIASLILVLRAIFKGYEDVGFGAAFATTQRGVGFEQSLKIADGSLDFLGLGADKLTKTGEFENAMIRCASGGRAVRMLLSPPHHSLLEMLARRNGVDPLEYSKNVRESLRRIAKVKTERALNIQVRFYPLKEDRDLQVFRLMFLNGTICLWSWTVWGPHRGSNNPQVVLLHRQGSSQTGAYNAFHNYFERLWEDPRSEVVGLADYL